MRPSSPIFIGSRGKGAGECLCIYLAFSFFSAFFTLLPLVSVMNDEKKGKGVFFTPGRNNDGEKGAEGCSDGNIYPKKLIKLVIFEQKVNRKRAKSLRPSPQKRAAFALSTLRGSCGK